MQSAATVLVRRRRSRLSAGRRRAAQRGAVAVETALVTPVLIVVLLGIIELPMLVRDYVAVTSAARTGARVGSAAPSASGPSVASGFSQIAADAVGRSGRSLPAGSLKAVLVYKANSDGFPGGLSSLPSTCGGISDCVTLTWSDVAGAFTVSGGSWPSSTVNACFPGNVDALGVGVIAEHKFFNGLIGSTMTMSDHAVMDFEPMPVGRCASGSHA